MAPRCHRTDWEADCLWEEKVPGRTDCREHGGRTRNERDRLIVLSHIRAAQHNGEKT